MGLGIDFDGVIHSYTKGFHDGTLYDEPVENALLSVRNLLEHWNIFIFSVREPEQIAEWLKTYDAPFPYHIITDADIENARWTREGVVGITQRKLVARFYIDDRAITFDSKEPRAWDKVIEKLVLD